VNALLRHVFLLVLSGVAVSPSLAFAGRPSVLVNPHVAGNGTAKTIRQGIEMVDPGGKVMVLPGTYDEAFVIPKGLTLEAVGGESAPVIVEPSGTPAIAIQITTSDPVVIRGLTLRYSGVQGIRAEGLVDVTVEDVTVVAVNPPLGVGNAVSTVNDPNPSGGRGKLAVRGTVVYQEDEFVRQPSFSRTNRYDGMITYKPFKNTTLRGSFEHYENYARRPNAILPRDAVTYWQQNGRPTWDPSTWTVTRNGVKT